VLLVTGGAGFIGSHFILKWLAEKEEPIINIDKLTHYAHETNLSEAITNMNYRFVEGDICDSHTIENIFSEYTPRAVIHFAAESHVDTSIASPEHILMVNTVGTFKLLETARKFWCAENANYSEKHRFLNISTDEVYGSLGETMAPFTETSQISPNSPYSASKAASDHWTNAYYKTYGLPTITTNCSNNYGPKQFPEKLIPLCVRHAVTEQPIPIYGDGMQIRDWLHVDDHCSAIIATLDRGQPGQRYNIGGNNEQQNLFVVKKICQILDDLIPRETGGSYSNLIKFISDRPGHDNRYAVNNTKISSEIGWIPKWDFDAGLKSTAKWYLENHEWLKLAKREQI
jgi:dTDP-glucose 4,6-dehydratase